MYAKRIIPCLDVKNGRVVKGMSFVNLVDAGDPVESAMQYDRQGADELVFLDITASSDSRAITIDMVEKVANAIFIPFTVGGGIRSVDDFNALLRAGADKVSVNSAAVHRPELISEAAYKFGSQCVVAAIDAKRKGDGTWEVYINGGRKPVGLDAVEWAVRCGAMTSRSPGRSANGSAFRSSPAAAPVRCHTSTTPLPRARRTRCSRRRSSTLVRSRSPS